MAREPIRLRLIPRKSFPYSDNPRVAFWQAVKGEEYRDQEIDAFEAKLQREFGGELRQQLIDHLGKPLDQLAKSRASELDLIFFRFYDRPRFEKDIDRVQMFDYIIRFIEQNQEEIRENSSARIAREKIALASSVIFNLRVVGYSSLNLDLFFSSIDKLREIFDNDFDSFCVFLGAFCPMAYAEVFSEEDADRIDFSIKVPDSYRSEFSEQPKLQETKAAAMPQSDAISIQKSAKARDRAEWLWRIANGSLFVPFIIALVVMYEGITVLKGIEDMQYNALKPVLDLQLNLLEEDRVRLLKELPPAITTQTTSSPIAK